MDRQKHFFTLFLGTGLNVVLGVITTPIVTRLVQPDVYGQLSVFTLYGSVLLVFMLFGQDQAYNRFYYAQPDQGYKRYILGLTARGPIFISILISAGICAYYILNGSDNKVLLIFAVYTISMVVDRFTNMTLRLDMKSAMYSFTMNMQKLTYTMFVVIAVYFTNVSHIIILTGCTVLAQIVSCVIGMVVERDKWRIGTFFLKEKDKYGKVVNFRKTLKYGWPFIFSSLCAWLFTGADKLMIQFLSNDTQLGIYASALSIIGIFSVITNTFTTIWAPMAVEEYEKKSGSTAFFVKATDYIAIVLFAAGAGVILFKDLIVFLLGPEYREAVFLIPFLSLYPVLYTISESTVYGINFLQKTQWHIIITGACGILNVVLNYFLINAMGSLGAAVATGITYTVLLILRTYFSLKCFPVKYHLKKMTVMIVLYYIFVIYNSYFRINWICAAMFTIMAAVGIILYRDSIKELLAMTFDYLKHLTKKVKRK